MKAQVYVTLKPGVLDPQGKAIKRSVELLGFGQIADVRQGKFFEISLGDEVAAPDAQERVDRLAREVLSNPVIEDYHVELIP
jgi:phosphoribosylformylglycinamidine synthase